MTDLREAAEALGAMPEGYCFCSENRIGDDSKVHEPECADLRAALSASPTTEQWLVVADVERVKELIDDAERAKGHSALVPLPYLRTILAALTSGAVHDEG